MTAIQNPQIRVEMRTITNETIGLGHAGIQYALEVGVRAARDGDRDARRQVREARGVCAAVRAQHGFVSRPAPLLTPPGVQHKLGLAAIPTYGLTLFHNTFRTSNGDVWNLCPSAGDCVKVCVVGNGNGRWDNVQRGWKWRTQLLTDHPWSFFVLLGYELWKAVDRHLVDFILVRPNVNSDVEWHKVAPALVDGSVFGDTIKFYGYTKHTDILDGDGWLTPHYRVAYSWNENSAMSVVPFLRRGGSVAVVTDRYYTPRTRQPVQQWASAEAEHHSSTGWYWKSVNAPALDADLSDEWIFQSGVIGDLAYKPRTSKLRAWGQETRFVVKVYGTGGRMQTLDEVTVEVRR